ncbi:hypothetical protein OE903_05725 [Bacillus sp. B6(2022)]|nr:hypothetical protein [Bacillus sp. B6(2022)]
MMISAGLTFILAKVLGKVAGIFYSNQQPFAELNQVNLLIEKNDCFPRDHAPFLFFYLYGLLAFRKGVNVLLSCFEWVEQKWAGERTK